MRVSFLLLSLSALACAAPANDEAGIGTPEDEAAIRAQSARYEAAWNARSMDSMVALMADSYEDVMPNGTHVDGIDAVKAMMGPEMAQTPPTLQMSSVVTFVQFVDDHAAIASGTYALSGMPPEMPASMPTSGAWLAVFKKIGTEWKVTSSMAAPNIPMPDPSMPDSMPGMQH